MPGAIYVAVGGAIGAVGRYLASLAVVDATGAVHPPLGTLVVNVLGCLAVGTVAGLADVRGFLSDEVRLFLLVGVLGGFTTFSSFGLETFELMRRGSSFLALTHVAVHLIAGLGAVALAYRAVARLAP